MVNQFNPQDQIAAIKARREERNRKTQALLAQFGGSRGAGIARELANTQQQTLDAPSQPQIPAQQQQAFEQAQAATQQRSLPFGTSATVGADTGAMENRGNPEFGSFFGSGVLENVAGKGLGALENVQKGIETVGGVATAVTDQLTPGKLFANQNDGRGFLEILKETQEESGRGGSLLDAAGQAQNLASAFRSTDMPSFKVDLIPGKGIDLPGDATLNEFQFGWKGAIELLPDALLTVATGGAGAIATGSRLGLVKGAGTVAARTVGLDVLAAGVKAIPKIVTKSADIKTIAAPVYRNVTNLSFNTGLEAIQRAKVPEMREMLNRVTSASSAAGGALSGVMHRANPVMLLENGKKKLTDIVYGRINALSLIPGAVEANQAVLLEKLNGIGNAPKMVEDASLGEGRLDIGRRAAGSPVGRGFGRIRDKIFGPNDEAPMFVYNRQGLVKSEAFGDAAKKQVEAAGGKYNTPLDGRVWTDAVSNAFIVSKKVAYKPAKYVDGKMVEPAVEAVEEGNLVIRLGEDSVIPSELAEHYIPVSKNNRVINRDSGSYDVPEQFDRYVEPRFNADGTMDLVETEGTRFYTASHHMIDTYQDMRKHYEWTTGKMIQNTAKLRFADSAYVPQVPNGGDWFKDIEAVLEGKRSAGVKPGDKKRPLHERTVYGDDLQDAVDNGHYEMAGPMEALSSFMTNMYTQTIDDEMIKHINVLAKDSEIGSVINFGKIKGSITASITRMSKGGNAGDKFLDKLQDAGFEGVVDHMKKVNALDTDKRAKEIEKLRAVFAKEKLDLQGQYYAIDEGRRHAPAFAGIMFRDAEEVNAAGKKVTVSGEKLRDEVSKAADLGDASRAEGSVELLAEAGDLLRVGKTGFDFGFHMIHGIPALGIATGRFLAGHPKQAAELYTAWGKSVKNTVDAFFRPKVLMETLMKDPALVMEAVENGLQLSREAQDFFLATQNASLLRKIPKAGESMDGVLADLAKSFERAFVAPGDLLRIEGYRIMRNTAGQSETGLAELSGFLNKMTGALSSSASGVSRGQQQLERGLLFFSPRYTRSAMALLTDVYRGGVKGELARQTMVGMAFFGVASYTLISNRMGQEAKLDPSKSDFMTVQMGDSSVGVGGFWTQYVRLASKLAETAWDTDAQEAFGDASENPLFRWVRSRAAPGAGVAWDIANGEDYMGRQFTSVGDTIKHAGRQSMPIWLEAWALEDPYRTGPAGITAEVLGSRTNPLSASKRRRQLRDAIAVEAYDKKWNDLNTQQRKSITEGKAAGMTSNEIVQLDAYTKEVLSGNADRNEAVDVNIEQWHAKREEIDLTWKSVVDAGIDHLQTEGSGVDPKLFRELYLGSANSQRRTRLEDLNNPEGDFALTMSYYTDVAEKFGNEHPEDVAYSEYIDNIVATGDFDDPNGYDFRRRDDAVLAFRQRWGDDVYAYVQETFAVGRDLPPIVEEFYKGRAKFEYYWRGVEELTLSKMPRAGEVKETYQQYLDADANGKRQLKDQDRLLSKYINLMSSVKKQLRKKDAMLDAWLFRWGYTDTLSHKDNRVAPDKYSNPREYWRQPEDFPLSKFGIGAGVNLPAFEQPSLQLDA
jgi:hypothetical protein